MSLSTMTHLLTMKSTFAEGYPKKGSKRSAILHAQLSCITGMDEVNTEQRDSCSGRKNIIKSARISYLVT